MEDASEKRRHTCASEKASLKLLSNHRTTADPSVQFSPPESVDLVCNLRPVMNLFLLIFLMLAWPLVGSAQEDVVAPPAPLQWPRVERGANANGRIPVDVIRSVVEEGANVQICKELMKDAGKSIPTMFTIKDCPPAFLSKIQARQGKISWALGARPTECGAGCFGRPFMTRSDSLTRPNTNFVKIFGSIALDVDVKTVFTRTVHFGYELEFRCQVKPGQRKGSFVGLSIFGRPVVDEPDFFESFANFLVPIRLSDAITAGIQSEVAAASDSKTLAPCTSIGAKRAGEASADFIRFNKPSVVVNPVSIPKKIAIVRLHKITRKTQFGFNHPPDEAGGFHVFVNGVQGFIPDAAVRNLPVGGGSVSFDFCKTIDFDGANRLQIIFVNTHGGAVWSQFNRRSRFGTRGPHTMTTGRTIVQVGPPGAPNPLTGVSSPGRPESLLVREFELLYSIEVRNAPKAGASDPQLPDSGGATTGPLSTEPGVVNTGTGRGKPPQPCRKI